MAHTAPPPLRPPPLSTALLFFSTLLTALPRHTSAAEDGTASRQTHPADTNTDASSAGDCHPSDPFPHVYLSSKTPYHAPEEGLVDSILRIAASEGYAPSSVAVEGVSYVGRHASRYATKLKECRTASAVMSKSPLFHDWPGCDAWEHRVGMLTNRGRREARGLGLRLGNLLQRLMPHALPSWAEEGRREGGSDSLRLASWPAGLSVRTTEPKRTQETAAEFLKGLHTAVAHSTALEGDLHCEGRLHQRLCCSDFYRHLDEVARQGLSFESASEDRELRFYDICPTYLQGWARLKQSLPSVARSAELLFPELGRRLGLRLFPPGGDGGRGGGQLTEDEVEALYKQCIFTHVVEDEAGRTKHGRVLCGLFGTEDLNRLARYKDAKDFYKKGPGAKGIGGFDMACRLFGNMLAELGLGGSGQGPPQPVRLRFAHAETLIPLLALLQERGVVKTQGDVTASGWSQADLCPMAANVLLVKVKVSPSAAGSSAGAEPGEGGSRLVFFHNERPVQWSLPACAGRYFCPYADVVALFPTDACVWEDMCSGGKSDRAEL